jgi:hypothetical protein
MEIEKIKFGLACVSLGAFALFGLGFGVGGWVLGDTAKERAETAVVERLTPICVAQSKQDPTKNRKIKELKKLEYSKRGKFVESQGWATMPGESKPDSAVAEMCGERISG